MDSVNTQILLVLSGAFSLREMFLNWVRDRLDKNEMKFTWGVSVDTFVFNISPFFPSGYGMSGDLKCVLATWHQLLEEPFKMEGMLDLLSIHQKVTISCLSK